MFKKLFFVMMLATIFVLPNACFAKQEKSIQIKQYVSKDGSFTLVYPDIFKSIKEDKRSNKVVFIGKTKNLKLELYQEDNSQKLNGYNLLEKAKLKVSHIQSEKCTKNSYILVYSNDGGRDGAETFFAERAVANKGIVVKYVFIYPAEQKAQLEPCFKQIKVIFKKQKS